MKTPLAILFGALPFVFGMIRVVETGSDFRYLWVALASLAGAAALPAVAGPSIRRHAVRRAAGVFGAAATSAAFAALLLGTRMGPGLLIVAAAFGVCFAVGSTLHSHARV